jgi:Kef-type K+ transport system membrane component KefB
MILAYSLYDRFAPQGVSFLAFSLFIGIAMSITAFPVLARIIQERGLTKTRLGIIAITCAAADDVTAWCLLAAVIAIVKAGSFVSAFYTISMAIMYVLFMLTVARPILAKMGRVYSSRERMNKTIVAILFLVLLSSAWMAEIIGIHALFGAFLAGVIMPTGFTFRKLITDKVEDVSLVLLLPLFFVFTGLKTRIDLLNDPQLWFTSALIIAVAVTGKFGGSALAAKMVGQPWKTSLSIGALMNTRGLMELIVLNIGLELGILSEEMFTMLVLMALITTFMTGPALAFINFLYRNKSQTEEEQSIDAYRILISFGPALKGKKMLRIAHLLSYGRPETDITAMHLTPNPDVSRRDAKQYEKESFKLIKAEAKHLDISLHTLYRVTGDLTRDVISTANKNNFDFMLVGATKSVFTADQLGGKVKNYLDDIHCSIGVFIDKELDKVSGILLCTDGTENESLYPLLPHLPEKKGIVFRTLDIHNQVEMTKMTHMLNPSIDLLIMNRITWEKLNASNSLLTENYSILILQNKNP